MLRALCEKLFFSDFYAHSALWKRDNNPIGRFYERLQDSGAGLGDTQEISRRYFSELLDYTQLGNHITALDIGCGEGDFIDYLTLDLPHVSLDDCLGVDLVQSNIAVARAKHPGNRFVQDSFLNHRFERKYDLVIAKGVLESRTHFYERYLEGAIRKMLSLSNRYVAFNVITHIEKGALII
ncbi:MAG TPA: class I SAM-dependent methyltransferase [Candidatus Nanoarchaeia archaeon]|nr:class I SAM-dependent methyltransferase [Candidatus Nanoarchaeia archaeon]